MENENTPATKADLVALDEKLEMLRSETTHQYHDLREAIRDSQTEMLKAFYNFAESNNKRVAQNEVNEVANRARIETLERRVTELEQRLNIPPAA
jgi:hypothetical protein